MNFHQCFLFCFPFFQARQEKKPFASFKPAVELDTMVQDLKWSPVEAFTLALCFTDGSMFVLDVKETVKVVAQLPGSVGITCGKFADPCA